jgi:hypothetical protein
MMIQAVKHSVSRVKISNVAAITLRNSLVINIDNINSKPEERICKKK